MSSPLFEEEFGGVLCKESRPVSVPCSSKFGCCKKNVISITNLRKKNFEKGEVGFEKSFSCIVRYLSLQKRCGDVAVAIINCLSGEPIQLAVGELVLIF